MSQDVAMLLAIISGVLVTLLVFGHIEGRKLEDDVFDPHDKW